MIIEFSIANFLSFKERVTFSMLANSSNGLDDNYIEFNNKKILKTSAIYGANASGKSNLFKVLTNVILMLRNSNNADINSNLPIVPFKFDKEIIDTNKPSEFEIKFIVDEIRYVYGFLANTYEIYEEYLYYYPNGRETKIFDRINIDEYSYTQKDERVLREIEKKNAPNKFFLATATNWNFEKTKPAYNFLTMGIGTCFNLDTLKVMALSEYAKNEKLKEFALDFLKKADFNIEDYKVVEVTVPEDIVLEIRKRDTNVQETTKFFHILIKHKGSTNYLSLEEESLGTQMIFALIPFIADSINNKKILVIDELDKSLHPFLVQYIVEMFNDSEFNKNGAQLIFNTHDTNLLNLNILRRDQIWFVEKNNDNGVSDLYPLSDFSVRKLENVEKGYMLGRYGAVPFIKNDLNLWDE